MLSNGHYIKLYNSQWDAAKYRQSIVSFFVVLFVEVFYSLYVFCMYLRHLQCIVCSCFACMELCWLIEYIVLFFFFFFCKHMMFIFCMSIGLPTTLYIYVFHYQILCCILCCSVVNNAVVLLSFMYTRHHFVVWGHWQWADNLNTNCWHKRCYKQMNRWHFMETKAN